MTSPSPPSASGTESAATRNPRQARAARWALGVAAAIMSAIGLVLLFLLTVATNNRALYERNYAWLFGLNVLVALLLFAVLVWVAVRLVVRLRKGRFGSRLLVKLAGIFAVVGLVPGLLIYVVSYQFVSRSIESWFDVKVEGALTAGVSLARATLDTLASDMATQTRTAGTQLAQVPDAAAGLVLERIRDQLGATDIVLFNGAGQPVASVGQSRFDLSPERPAPQLLRNARQQRSAFQIEGLDDVTDPKAVQNARVKTLVAVGTASVGLLAEPRYLQATIRLPQVVVANALAVQEANREYQERALARGGLRRMYIGTLTLSLFLAVFGAVLLAVLLGRQLARPLLVLAEGVREVASGNLSPKAVLQTSDELGGLTRSFAVMTQQLADARSAVERSMGEVDAARARLQTILDNLTAGVIVMDAQGRIRSTNPGATRILRAPMAAFEGRPLADVPGLAAFASAVQAHFDAFLGDREQHGLDHWQHPFELHAAAAVGAGHSGHAGPIGNGTSLVARGAELPDALRLLVFDDISEIVSAQRAQAWGEVARRLAHEIKNPLTPIQLSAERLEMKLTGKLGATEEAILAKSVKTIVEQVDAMKRLVNEFRDYARLPAAELHRLDLNALVADILQLYGAENATVPVESELDPRCPPVAGDAQQLRQVIHNLLQNAQDASEQRAREQGVSVAPVRIATRWSENSRRVRLTVSDAGTGFPAHILQRAFEPYVTTKARGTGLGLAVVKKIADEHGARIDLSNRVEEGVVRGAQVSLSFAPETFVVY
ncbi:sensor histidine kinase [Paracidovorax konjaci]|uniref:histidine kinase n=1 Tax=Paracidovorax konjaci TaxID=32040 RepID=A0A1I1YEL3_9BURK|nr:ATP-binding protein [Paracidovorax konjaci]SFE16370.1 Signal transduction histidine kinase involved in nitrogen fixation and metabolism regulation [Paracidovorax konjaci]